MKRNHQTLIEEGELLPLVIFDMGCDVGAGCPATAATTPHGTVVWSTGNHPVTNPITSTTHRSYAPATTMRRRYGVVYVWIGHHVNHSGRTGTGTWTSLNHPRAVQQREQGRKGASRIIYG